MGVLLDPQIQGEVAYLLDDGSAECFVCHDALTTPYIFWSGVTGVLKVHPRCSIKLACCLIGDAKALEAGARAEKGRAA